MASSFCGSAGEAPVGAGRVIRPREGAGAGAGRLAGPAAEAEVAAAAPGESPETLNLSKHTS